MEQRKYAGWNTIVSLTNSIKNLFVSKEDLGTTIDSVLETAKEYTDTKTQGLASSSYVESSVSTHNTSDEAHNDIRILIKELTNKLNALADSDDEDLNQLSEIVTYIKNNKTIIEGITTDKVNTSDIINNLTTNSPNKVLAAAQGVAIKNLIDGLSLALEEHTHTINEISDVNVSSTELNYISGVTSNVQNQLNNIGNQVGLKSSVQIVTWEEND